MAGITDIELPTTAPTVAALAERDRWNKLVDDSASSVRDAAEKWRTGLAAFVTLVTGGLLIKGPEAATDLVTSWKIAITALASVGLFASIVGLWLALRAAAGSPAFVSLAEVTADHGGVRQFNVAAARAASRRLSFAKVAVCVGLVLLGAAVITWWWADKKPPEPSSPPAFVSIESVDDAGKAAAPVCGKLLSADRQLFRVAVAGESHPRSIRFDLTTNVLVTSACP